MAMHNATQTINDAITSGGERIRTGRGRLSAQDLRDAAGELGASVRFMHRAKTPAHGWVSTWRVWVR